jgi:hypothetical protein
LLPNRISRSFLCRLLADRRHDLVVLGQSSSFDPREFLANAGIGRTIQGYRAKQTIFSQGQSSDAVYYIQVGKVRLSVLSKQGKKQPSPSRHSVVVISWVSNQPSAAAQTHECAQEKQKL